MFVYWRSLQHSLIFGCNTPLTWWYFLADLWNWCLTKWIRQFNKYFERWWKSSKNCIGFMIFSKFYKLREDQKYFKRNSGDVSIIRTCAAYKRSQWRWLILKTNCYCLQYLPPYCLQYFTLSIPLSATKELWLLSWLLVNINRSRS